MKKENNNKQKSIPLFILKMVGIFALVDLFVYAGAPLLAIITKTTLNYGKYSDWFLSEIIGIIVILIVLFISKNKYVFTQKKTNFIKSLKFGIPLLVISIFYLGVAIVNISTENQSFITSNLISLILLCISVGVFEELLCRGWFQNELIERLGTDKKGIILSIICSSIVFGLFHIGNIIMQTPFETIIQVFYTFGLGLLLGTIYYKTKNIWSVIFLHGFYDFSLMLGQVNSIQDCTLTSSNMSVITILANIVPTLCFAICFIFTAYIIINSSLKEMAQTKNISQKTNQDNHKVIIVLTTLVLVIGMVLLLLIPDKVLNDYTCYEYKDKTLDKVQKVTYFYSDHKINYTNNNGENFNYEFKLINKYEKSSYIVIENLITNNSQKIEIENINDFILYENNNNYDILISTNNEIYYSNYITKNNLSNEQHYLSNIQSTLKKYTVPSVDTIGYMKDNETNNIYPYFQSELQDDFIIDKDSKVYLVIPVEETETIEN